MNSKVREHFCTFTVPGPLLLQSRGPESYNNLLMAVSVFRPVDAAPLSAFRAVFGH